MVDWKYLFRSHILERGLSYYETGAVDSVERTKDGYRAAVEGTEDYEVKIELRDGEIHDMSCTCPYAEDGNYCKHMAAVLYKIEEEDGRETSHKTRKEREQDSQNELWEVIKGIAEEELRHLVEDLASEDESLKNRILTKYARTISQAQMVSLKGEVDSIAYRYSDRGGFVDWRNAGNYVSQMEAFLYGKVQAVIDKGCYMQAFELTNHVFITVGNQDMDDSDGGTSMVADSCYELWQQILEECSEQDKTKMQSWFEKHQSDGAVIDYMEDYIRDFLLNEFHDKELLQKELAMLDEKIEKRGESTDCGKCYSAHDGFENSILKRIRLMKEMDATEEEIRQYREKNRRFAAVRMLEVEEFIQAGQDMDAVRVLKESKELDRESPDWIREYSQKLIDAYGRMHMETEYKEELLFRVFSCRQGGLDFVKKLKAACTPGEWEQYREKLLAAPTGQEIKLSLLESEKLYERLMDELAGMDCVYVLDQYEKALKKVYPDRMQAAYAGYVKTHAESVSDRKGYKELIKYLKKLASYPQGREEAERIAREWRGMYRRRPAMMDELERAGF